VDLHIVAVVVAVIVEALVRKILEKINLHREAFQESDLVVKVEVAVLNLAKAPRIQGKVPQAPEKVHRIQGKVLQVPEKVHRIQGKVLQVPEKVHRIQGKVADTVHLLQNILINLEVNRRNLMILESVKEKFFQTVIRTMIRVMKIKRLRQKKIN
jgi:hypothetical protein